MTSSSAPSARVSGPINLKEVRHEQRRVAALLQASGQITVSFPPHNSIPLEDLFKGKFYRQVQAARTLQASKGCIPSLGHPLLDGQPTRKGSNGNGGGQGIGAISTRPEQSDGDLPSVLTTSFGDEHPTLRRRQPASTKRTMSNSLPTASANELLASRRHQRRHLRSSGHVDDQSLHQQSFSHFETLPAGLGGRIRAGNVDKETRIDYRLPRKSSLEPKIIPERIPPPHLRYNFGDAKSPGNFNPLEGVQFSPTGWTTEKTPLDVLMHGEGHHHRRKKKRNRGHADEFNSDSSSDSSSSRPSLEAASTSQSVDDGTSSQGAMVIDEHLTDPHDNAPSNVNSDDYPNHPDINSSTEAADDSRKSPSTSTPSNNSTTKSRTNRATDDPYGRAYVQALSVARSKEVRKLQDPLYFGQRITRPFTFSYFCKQEVCQCGKCPPTTKKKKGKRGRKTGFKAIFGDVHMYDYFKWPNDDQ